MFHPLYKFVSPVMLEKRHREITKSMKELGNIPEEKLPSWAVCGKNESYRTIYDIIADYKNPSDNN